jgi:plastocyanin
MPSKRVGQRICGLVCAGTLLAGLGNSPASAQTADERTFFTFSGPVELPGIALAPGTGVATGVMLMAGGVLKGMPIGQAAHGAQQGAGGPRFVRVADAALEDGGQAAAADGSHVVVDNFSYAPATATVPVGTTVTWTNRDDIPHNVVSPEQKFRSPVLDTDEKFSHTFDVAGTYKYYCSIHPRMTGQVVVR